MKIKPLYPINLFRINNLFRYKADGIHLLYRQMDINLLELFYEDEETLWRYLEGLEDEELNIGQIEDLKEVREFFFELKETKNNI